MGKKVSKGFRHYIRKGALVMMLCLATVGIVVPSGISFISGSVYAQQKQACQYFVTIGGMLNGRLIKESYIVDAFAGYPDTAINKAIEEFRREFPNARNLCYLDIEFLGYK